MSDILTTSCRNTHINNIQCNYADTAQKYVKYLKYGGDECKERELKRQLLVAMSYLEILRCYKTFSAEPTFVVKLTFTNTDSSTVTAGDITVDGTSITGSNTYTGSGDGEDIADHFYNAVNDNTTSPDFSAVLDTNVVYVYSTDSALSESSTVVESNIGTQTASDVDNDYHEDILTIWNCLTYDQVCNIINHATRLVDEDCGC